MVFVSFDSLQPGDIGAETDQFDRVPFLRLDAAAQDDIPEWRKDLESKLRSGQTYLRPWSSIWRNIES